MSKRGYMKGMKKKADLTKPCRCGTGYYCHRHLAYNVMDTGYSAPQLMKVNHGKNLRPKTGSRAESMGGQH